MVIIESGRLIGFQVAGVTVVVKRGSDSMLEVAIDNPTKQLVKVTKMTKGEAKLPTKTVDKVV